MVEDKSGDISKNKYGYIDKTGKMVIEHQFDIAYPFSEGLAIVGERRKGVKGDDYGYIDKSGELVIDKLFYFAESFSEGFAAVDFIDGYCQIIDKKGNIVFNIENVAVYKSFSEGLAPVYIIDKDAYGYMNNKGEVVIEPQFRDAMPFSEGMAAVSLELQRWGYIDRTGKLVIDCQFNSSSSFKNGLAQVSLPGYNRGYMGYIDKTGKYIWREDEALGIRQPQDN